MHISTAEIWQVTLIVNTRGAYWPLCSNVARVSITKGELPACSPVLPADVPAQQQNTC